MPHVKLAIARRARVRHHGVRAAVRRRLRRAFRQITVASCAHGAAQRPAIIHGTVVDTGGTPLANASVRLRNLKTHQVDQITTANQNGEFRFTAQPQIPLRRRNCRQCGQIIAVGDIVDGQAGEAAALVVSTPMRLPPWLASFGDTAGSVFLRSPGRASRHSGQASPAEPPPASQSRANKTAFVFKKVALKVDNSVLMLYYVI